jgi:hypothetical protein
VRPWLPLSLAGCASLQALPPDAPCVEAGYAISRRTFECTGDAELANARFERYRREFECIDLPKWSVDTGEVTKFLEAEGSGAALSPPDYFHCAFAIELLPCELVAEYGDDLSRWLEGSNACAWIVEPRGGR